MAWYGLAKSKICHRQDEGKTDYHYTLLATESPIIYIYTVNQLSATLPYIRNLILGMNNSVWSHLLAPPYLPAIMPEVD